MTVSSLKYLFSLNSTLKNVLKEVLLSKKFTANIVKLFRELQIFLS